MNVGQLREIIRDIPDEHPILIELDEYDEYFPIDTAGLRSTLLVCGMYFPGTFGVDGITKEALVIS
jgi:hypothetical protein